MKPRTSKPRMTKQTVSDETIVALIDNIQLLNTSIVAMSDELRHWSQENRRRAVEEWASHELQSRQLSLTDTPEATESLTENEKQTSLKRHDKTEGNSFKVYPGIGNGR